MYTASFLLHLFAIIGVAILFFAMIVAISLDIVEGLKVFEGRMHLFLSLLCLYYSVFFRLEDFLFPLFAIYIGRATLSNCVEECC